MELSEACVGQRVRSLTRGPDGNSHIYIGSVGTVCHTFGYSDGSGRIGVEWDEHVSGHDCQQHCEDGYGWYVDPEYLEPIDDEEPEEDFQFDAAEFCDMLGVRREEVKADG